MKSRVLAGVFLVAGAVAALGLASMWSGDDPFESFGGVASADADLDRVERRLDRLEAAVLRLTSELATLQLPYVPTVPAPRADVPSAPGTDPRQSVDLTGMYERLRRMNESGNSLAFMLENAGMSAARAAAIETRVDELLLEAMERELHGGQTATSLESHEARERYIGQQLREEFGVGDYERYRVAKGLLTEVPVVGIEAGSAAERAGLLPNDEIVSYNGERVMEFAELEALAAQPSPGSLVLVEILRDGRLQTLTVPAGPLGVVEPTANDLMTLRVRGIMERTRPLSPARRE